MKGKVTNFVSSFAVSNWQKYPYRKEWAAVILLLLILKLATSAVSIFSGYFYLSNFFYGFTNSGNASLVFAVVALCIIEGLCALFLAKFFKFALRLEFKTAILPLICASLVFWISFIVSTNGIALYAEQSEDLSREISDKYAAYIDNAKAQCDRKIADANDYINTQKQNPLGWQGGRRCMLTDFQTQQIAKAYDDIENARKALALEMKIFEEKRDSELVENNKQTLDTSTKYYKIVALIMLVQIVCSGALWFFWGKIAAQDCPDVEYQEAVTDVRDRAAKLIDRAVNNGISDRLTIIDDAFSLLKEGRKATAPAIGKAATAVAFTPKRAGFAVPDAVSTDDESEQKNVVFTAETETAQDVTTFAVSDVNAAVKTPAVNVNKGCLFCGKPLTDAQIYRHAKYCCDSCRVKAYNARNPKGKQINIAENKLS